jgi:NitT/TauT family transport system substrate-binding protein
MAGSSAASSAAASVAASAPASEATGASSAAGSAAGALKPVSIAMGYIPDVQFAMFYVAQAKGYYKDAGLDVTISHGFVTDAVVQVAQGRLTFANAAGDEILLARANKIPVKLIFQTYQQYPVAVFSKASAGITAPEGLKGKTVGVPFRSGATYIGLRGILYAAKMSESDINLAEINFTQVEAVRTDKVAAAVGYSNHEPRILEAAGVPVNVLKVSDYIQLVSNGIITSENFASTEPDTVRAFVQATAHGLADTIADPDAAFKLTLPFIPELAAERQPQELAKLKESALLWHSPATDANGLGYSDPAAWETTHRFLRDSALLQTDVDVTQAYTNDLRK